MWSGRTMQSELELLNIQCNWQRPSRRAHQCEPPRHVRRLQATQGDSQASKSERNSDAGSIRTQAGIPNKALTGHGQERVLGGDRKGYCDASGQRFGRPWSCLRDPRGRTRQQPRGLLEPDGAFNKALRLQEEHRNRGQGDFRRLDCTTAIAPSFRGRFPAAVLVRVSSEVFSPE